MGLGGVIRLFFIYANFVFAMSYQFSGEVSRFDVAFYKDNNERTFLAKLSN